MQCLEHTAHMHTHKRQTTQAAACTFLARACCLRQLRQRASKPPSIHLLLGQKRSKRAAAAGTRACVVGGHQSDTLLCQQQHTQFKSGSRDRCCSRASPGMPVAAYAHTSVAPCGGLFSHTLSRRACQMLPLLLPSGYRCCPRLRRTAKAPPHCQPRTQQLPRRAASKRNMPAGVLHLARHLSS